MKRPFQISLRWIFGAVLVAACLAWLARQHSFLAAFPAACLAGSVWWRRLWACAAGGFVGASVCLYAFMPDPLPDQGGAGIGVYPVIGAVIGCLVCYVRFLFTHSAPRPSVRRCQFTLRAVFMIVLMAAVLAWAARDSTSEAAVLVAAFLGAIVPRRFIGSLLGALAGVLLVCLVVASVRHYGLLPNGPSHPYRALYVNRTGELHVLLATGILLGITVGALIGGIKELRLWHHREMARRDQLEINW